MEEPHEADGCSWRDVTASARLSKGRGNSSAFGRGLPAVIIDGSGTARFAASAAAAASAARAADQTAAAAAAAFFSAAAVAAASAAARAGYSSSSWRTRSHSRRSSLMSMATRGGSAAEEEEAAVAAVAAVVVSCCCCCCCCGSSLDDAPGCDADEAAGSRPPMAWPGAMRSTPIKPPSISASCRSAHAQKASALEKSGGLFCTSSNKRKCKCGCSSCRCDGSS